MADNAVAARRLHLALAAAGGAVSVDALVHSGLWTPASLWALLDDARREGLVATDDVAGPGHLRVVDAARRDAALAAATPEDYAALLSRAPFPELLLSSAQAALRAGELRRAAALHRALAAIPDPALFPGGEAAWVAVVVRAIRLVRFGAIVSAATVQAATASAEARGDLGAQAVLFAAQGLNEPDAGRAHGLFERAVEAAEALGDPAIRGEVGAYIGVALVGMGRLRDGIAAFEEMLGDVAGDVLDPRTGPPLDLQVSTPASAVAILAFAYSMAGEFPRAVDLLERMVARGVELGSAALEAQGRLFLALTRVSSGEHRAGRADAEAAHAYWSATGGEPAYGWLAATVLAAVRAEEGALAEARDLLEGSLPTWNALGRPAAWAASSWRLDLLARLEEGGLPAPPELALDAELARLVDAPLPTTAGVAHRFRARRLLAAGGEGAAARAAADLEHAVRLLRSAETAPELQLALADAAALADAQGRTGDATRLRTELAELVRAAPAAGAPLDPLRLATAILELGRLGALPRREGLWGEVAARLCRELGAERCAIVEVGPGGPALLAARGAPAWQEAVRARASASSPREPSFGPPVPQPGHEGAKGQLVLVPFADEELGRRGWIALENRDTPARVGPEHEAVLRALGRQMGILLANVAMWRELLDARQRLEQETRYYREDAPSAPLGGGRIIGDSPAMREVLGLVARVAPTSSPVLVTGETGVGKELVSREVHHLSSRRRGPFIAVNVAALAPGLVASALFGHERGAFTGATEQARGRFELADGGTIFLDEVGELSPADQVRLLRVLQEGTFERVGGTRVLRSDFRLVAATNRDLQAEVRAGRFREDLWFRLAAFPIRVPSLRERREEIPTLALYFLARAARQLGVAFDGIAEVDMERLVAYPWPGNVRELEHFIERAAILSRPPRFAIPALETGPTARLPGSAPAAQAAEEWVTLEEADRRYLRKVLHHVGGRVNGAGGAAELLGLKPSTLQFWIDKLGLRGELKRARERAGARAPRAKDPARSSGRR